MGMEQEAVERSFLAPLYNRKGVTCMKTIISMFALVLALGFAGPSFAGDVTTAKNQADCEKAQGSWDASTNVCSEKKM